MQIGNRWPVGAQPPRLPDALIDHIRQIEADLSDAQRQRWGWTLTWLEGRPVVELDDGTVLRWDPAFGVEVETGDGDPLTQSSPAHEAADASGSTPPARDVASAEASSARANACADGRLTIDEAHTLWNVAAAERAEALATRPLLVLLHGWGARESDLFSVAEYLPERFVVAAPRAPLDVPTIGGYSWFAAGSDDARLAIDGPAAARAVVRWVEAITPSGIDRLSFTALGFSQGGAVATELVRSAPETVAQAVNLSGFVFPGSRETDAELTARRPRVFWGHADDDAIIPAAFVLRTAQWLPQHTDVTERVYSGAGHSITREELDDVSAFLDATEPGSIER